MTSCPEYVRFPPTTNTTSPWVGMASYRQTAPADAREKTWLRRTGLRPGLAAKLVYAIIAGGDTYGKSKRQKSERNNELIRLVTDRRRECERLYKTWKYPGSGLDFMQLAVVCNNLTAVRHMSIEFFVTKYEYRDYIVSDKTQDNGLRTKEVPKNHPVFLACYLGRREILEELQSKVFLTFRHTEVTVTVHDSRCSPSIPVVPLPSPVRGSPMDLASRTGNVYCNVNLIKDYTISLRFKSTLSRQDIECLWSVMDVVYVHGTEYLTSCFCSVLRSKADLFRDFLLLNCQLFCMGSWPTTGSCLLMCTPLASILVSTFFQKRPDLLHMVAAHCSQKQLSVVLTYLQNDDTPKSRPHVHCSHHREFSSNCQEVYENRDVVIPVFQQERRQRTLRDETMRAILRSVGGNPVRAQKLDCLPRPLLDLFDVPFRDMHSKLTCIRK